MRIVKEFYKYRPLLLLISLIILSACNTQNTREENPNRPNILLIVADDMGFSDIGAFGGEISTPTLDAIASDGIRLSNFRVLPTCSPTRSVLLSGIDNHLSGLGTMGEIVTPDMAGIPGYAGYLNFEVAALPEVLKLGGYRTYLAGKWHLGLTWETSPYARGFDETFTLLTGGGSHWNDKAPMTPVFPMKYRRNGELVDTLPEDFYSTKSYTDYMLEWISRDQHQDEPFFAFLSYTAPHDPLHAPTDYIAKYRGKYDGGWEQLRARRLAQLQSLGIVPNEITPFPWMRNVKPWESLSQIEKSQEARNMEVYAAMLDYMDDQIKRIVDHLKRTGEYENTMILFFSDNGANGSDGRVLPGMTEEFMASFDNSIENRGLQNSYIHMGPGWAQASSAPFRLMKAFPAEGGIRSPMIVKLPNKNLKPGHLDHTFFHVRDVMPTILDLANVKHPDKIKDRPVLSMQGRSVLDLWKGKTDSIYSDAKKVGYEFVGFKAYFEGDWKILKLPKPFGTGHWELFNIKDDPGETNDLSQQYPNKRDELILQWRKYKEENNVLDISRGLPNSNN